MRLMRLLILGAAMALAGLATVDAQPKARVAILKDTFPSRPGNSDPEYLKTALERGGFTVTVLDADGLAKSSVLTSTAFDCLILPYGPSYPYAAYDSIRAYLRSGGCFVSMGGYAFDEPCERDPSGDMVPMARPGSGEGAPKCLNTRFGKPGDTMGLSPDQIGVFDPSYHLKYVASMRPAAGQFVIPRGKDARLRADGYSACSLLGSNSPVFPDKWGRHVALVGALDAHGRPRGDVGSMALNYAGPYAGSCWAFFGVTSTDLFMPRGPLTPHLGAIVDAVVRRTFLHSLTTDLASYEAGEPVSISCVVANLGRTDQAVEARFRVFDRAGKRVFESEPARLSLKAGATETVSAEFRPASFSSDLYRVVAELAIKGKPIDVMETGFVARDPKVTASGPKLSLENNYLRIGERPVFLSGANVTGAIFYSGNENPLVWDRDLARMSENGLNILRVLHFSPFVSDKPSASAVRPLDLAIDRLPPKTERKLDALVQLCQKHNVALFLSIHDWMPCELTDGELAAQQQFATTIAARYKSVPGFMIDIQNEPHIELPKQTRPTENADVVTAWNDYLRGKYQSDDALRAAWKHSPPESPLGSVPWHAGTEAWDDMRTWDADYFRNALLNRWAAANYTGAKEGNPSVPTTVGFLQEYFAVNKLMCVDGLDFANMHSYNTVEVLRGDMKLFDRRFQGKSLSLGEFGALSDHEKRVHGEDNPDQDINRYLQTGHYLLGEGGSFMASWCWKDMDDVIFPWGMNFTCEGPPKDLLKAYRNQSLLFRQIRPLYQPPSVFLVIPVETMIGARATDTIKVLYEHVDALLSTGVEFAAIDDHHLDKLPSSARVLVYPIPMSIPDEAYGRLLQFVRGGGTLCIAGDISYDERRQRTKTDRFEEMCGVRFVSEDYSGASWGEGHKPCITVEPVSAKPGERCFVNKLGDGEVLFTPVPSASGGDTRDYVFAGTLRPFGVELPGSVQGLPLHEAQGSVSILVNDGASAEAFRVGRLQQTPVETTLQPKGTGLVGYRGDQPWAIESQGTIAIGSVSIPAKGHFALLTLDGKDILRSEELAILPFGEAEIDLSALPGLRDGLVQTGDVSDGKWTPMAQSSSLKIRIDNETAFDIRIIAPRDRLASLGSRVVRELMLR